MVRVHVAGVNYIDTHQRTGRYPLDLPVTLGLEGVGEVVSLGEGVDHLALGDVVAWAWAQGSYAEFALVSQDKAVIVPEGIAMDDAVSAMMQGITAHYLTTSVYDAQPGDTALVHAAAGGAGLLLCQMLSARGVEVNGTQKDTPHIFTGIYPVGRTGLEPVTALSRSTRENWPNRVSARLYGPTSDCGPASLLLRCRR